MRKLLLKLFLPIVLLFSLVNPVFAEGQVPPKPHTNIYVQDYAGIVSPEIESEILRLGSELDQKTTAQLVVVTVDSLEGIPREDYALNLFRTWGIGNKEKNNGVLLLIALNERQSRIEVGYGLEGALPDGKTGRIQDDYLIPYFKEEDYNGGIYNTYVALAGEIAGEYQTTLSGDFPVPQTASQTQSLPPWATAVIVVGIILLIYLDFRFLGGMLTWMLLSSFRGGGRGGGGGGFGGGSSGGGGSNRDW